MGVFDFLKKRENPNSLFRNYGMNKGLDRKQDIVFLPPLFWRMAFNLAVSTEITANILSATYGVNTKTGDGIIDTISMEVYESATTTVLIPWKKDSVLFNLIINGASVFPGDGNSYGNVSPASSFFPLLTPYRTRIPFKRDDTINIHVFNGNLAPAVTLLLLINGFYLTANIID